MESPMPAPRLAGFPGKSLLPSPHANAGDKETLRGNYFKLEIVLRAPPRLAPADCMPPRGRIVSALCMLTLTRDCNPSVSPAPLRILPLERPGRIARAQ
jgi:hypothetical protein